MGRDDQDCAVKAFQVVTRAHEQMLYVALCNALKLRQNRSGVLESHGHGVVDKDFVVPMSLFFSDQSTEEEYDIEEF